MLSLGIQALYGAPGMTMPPTAGSDQDGWAFPGLPDGVPNICRYASFDAMFNHLVNGELKTFAFDGEYYMELDDFGLVEVMQFCFLSCDFEKLNQHLYIA